jgi:hypothetical protein
MMTKKFYSIAASCAFALTFGLSACSDDSSSGTNANIDTGDEINISVSDKGTLDNAFINEGWREDCLAKINEYRATENLPPYTLASEEKQTCADKQSADDLKSGKAHGHFGDCGEWAQNSGPNFSASFQKNASAVADYYLEMMWNEKKLVESGEADLNSDADFTKIGHYKNMHSTSYTKVACGITLSADGKTGWFNVDFF